MPDLAINSVLYHFLTMKYIVFFNMQPKYHKAVVQETSVSKKNQVYNLEEMVVQTRRESLSGWYRPTSGSKKQASVAGNGNDSIRPSRSKRSQMGFSVSRTSQNELADDIGSKGSRHPRASRRGGFLLTCTGVEGEISNVTV